MLVFNVKLRKETNYNIIALWDEQDSSFTLDAYMTPDFYDRAEDLYLMAYSLWFAGVLIQYSITRFVLKLISLILHSFLS